MLLNKHTQMLVVGVAEDFKVEVKIGRGNKKVKQAWCKLQKDKVVEGDGILWGMQRASVLKAHWSDQEIAYHDMMKALPPLKNGEVVLIVDNNVNGKTGFYRVKVNGNYSDACTFEYICSLHGTDIPRSCKLG